MKFNEALNLAKEIHKADQMRLLTETFEDSFTIDSDNIYYKATPIHTQEEFEYHTDFLEGSSFDTKTKLLILEKIKTDIQISILTLRFSSTIYSTNMSKSNRKQIMDSITNFEEMVLDLEKIKVQLKNEEAKNV